MQLKRAIWLIILSRKTFKSFLSPLTRLRAKTFTHRTQNKHLSREQKYLRLFLTKFWMLGKANYLILKESVDWNENSQKNKKYFYQRKVERTESVIHTYNRFSYQNTFHCVDCTRVLVVSCPVKRDFSFNIRNSNIWIMFYEKFHMLWVIVIGTPMQCSLLQHNIHKFFQHVEKLLKHEKLSWLKPALNNR